MIRALLVFSLLVDLCGPASQVSVGIDFTPAGGGAGPAVGYEVELYPLLAETDGTGRTIWQTAELPAQSALVDESGVAVFNWDPAAPFQVETPWVPVGDVCWLTGSERVLDASSSVTIPMYMVCE